MFDITKLLMHYHSYTGVFKCHQGCELRQNVFMKRIFHAILSFLEFKPTFNLLFALTFDLFWSFYSCVYLPYPLILSPLPHELWTRLVARGVARGGQLVGRATRPLAEAARWIAWVRCGLWAAAWPRGHGCSGRGAMLGRRPWVVALAPESSSRLAPDLFTSERTQYCSMF